MAWIKRNLFFVLGSLVALALMAGGGFFLFQQITDERAVAGKIAQQYAELKRLYDQTPHPGNKDIDNIKTARDQDAAFRDYIKKIHAIFERIPPIPDSGKNKVSNAEFATQLRITVAQLHHEAEQQSVRLPQDYYFTFEAQKKQMVFDPASLDSMAAHLGEIKAICEIIFNAKVNFLDSVRREKLSELNDNNPPDYLPQKTVTNTLAELTPYEVTFRCFSAELAMVMGEFASSPNGFVVKTINVEPAGGVEEQPAGGQPVIIQPQYYTPPPPSRSGQGDEHRGARQEYPQPQVMRTAPPVNRGPTAFLNEKPLRVTLSIVLVKLKPAK